MGEEGHPETSGQGSSKRRASRGISEFPSLGEIRGPSSPYPEPSSPVLGFLRFHPLEVQALLESTDAVEADLPERGWMVKRLG